jgi:replication factor A1
VRGLSSRRWRDEGHGQSFHSLTERGGGGGGGESGPLSVPELRMAVARIREAAAGDGVHVVKASITNIRHDDPGKMWYAACSATRDGRMCNKKMSETSPGTYSCDNCGENPVNFRYILSLTVADHSGSEYVTLFDNEGAQLLGQPAKVLQEWVATDEGRVAFERTVAAAEHREMLLTVKAKAEERAGESRIKVTAVKLREVDFARENKALLGALKRAASLV